MTQHLIPVPETVTVGGLTLVLSALTDRQHVELDRWAQAQMIDAARRSVPDGDDAIWDRIVALAMREAVSVTWSNSRASRTTAGYAHLVFVSASAKTDGLKEPDVAAAIAVASRPELKILNETFFRLNYSRQGDAKSDGNPPEPA